MHGRLVRSPRHTPGSQYARSAYYSPTFAAAARFASRRSNYTAISKARAATRRSPCVPNTPTTGYTAPNRAGKTTHNAGTEIPPIPRVVPHKPPDYTYSIYPERYDTAARPLLSSTLMRRACGPRCSAARWAWVWSSTTSSSAGRASSGSGWARCTPTARTRVAACGCACPPSPPFFSLSIVLLVVAVAVVIPHHTHHPPPAVRVRIYLVFIHIQPFFCAYLPATVALPILVLYPCHPSSILPPRPSSTRSTFSAVCPKPPKPLVSSVSV
ncbi:hypothetical protein HYPSUDRAFT_485596 [Hypholoma sublateritium FD-334 SS-4]|uniref:Uncharacterized protein n=1 Tax=Hypholoma sublateritium (strain FD-334 SS-4) TaxID=945553 RepID=A0A0D2KGY2_HYPSF|nr:hypothetical protein HYPSUDRAFT_485596 [Hypholoma sublateritium FD-334 SS-4]